MHRWAKISDLRPANMYLPRCTWMYRSGRLERGRRWRIKREIGGNIREEFVLLFKSLQTSAREFSRQGKQSSPILSSRYKFLRGNKARWPFLGSKKLFSRKFQVYFRKVTNRANKPQTTILCLPSPDDSTIKLFEYYSK